MAHGLLVLKLPRQYFARLMNVFLNHIIVMCSLIWELQQMDSSNMNWIFSGPYFRLPRFYSPLTTHSDVENKWRPRITCNEFLHKQKALFAKFVQPVILHFDFI